MAKSRNELEHAVAAVLNCCGLKYQPQKFLGDYDAYGAKIVVDYVVCAEAWGADRFVIECRQQITVGSADQKTHALVARAKGSISLPTIIVFCGEHAEGRTYAWAKDNIGGNFKAAVTFGEFIGLMKDISKGLDAGARHITSHDPNQKTIWGEYSL